MSVALTLERERIVRPREHLVASRLVRFAWRHREAVSALAYRHSRLGDLALSFPALLFALAVPRKRFDPEPVIERVIAGAPLSELAAAADLPMWTRKLMPEAFLHPIPHLPDSDLFRRQIANHIPTRPGRANPWLNGVARSAAWGTESLAVWHARHAGNPHLLKRAALLQLWAWHSENRDGLFSPELAGAWSPAMEPAQALAAAGDWADTVRVFMWMGDKSIADPWAQPAIIDGYSFEPVTTAPQLIAYARALQNCSRDYAYSLVHDDSRIWVVMRDGQLQAMLSLESSAMPERITIGQIRGPSNARVSPDLSLASTRWVMLYAPQRQTSGQTPSQTPSQTRNEPRGQPPDDNWRRLWRPYWLARRRIPGWLPLTPQRGAWTNIVNGVD